MRKIATLAAAALLAGTGTYALAQAPAPQPQAPAQEQNQGRPDTRRGMSQEDFNRLVDARVASIRAGLKLSPEQEGLWAPVETAIRNAANQRYTRMTQFRETREQRRSADFMQRLEQRSTLQTERAQTSAALATALRPLWNSLSEDQKRIAPHLMHEVVDGGRGWHERGGRRGHGRHHARMMEHHRGGHGGMGPGQMDSGGSDDAPQAPAPQQQ